MSPAPDAEGSQGTPSSAGRRSPTKYDAFISHASANRSVAAAIESTLGTDNVWLDRSDIRVGALLDRELLSRLRQSRAVILVWSNEASQSPWVQTEWIAASNMPRPILPLVLDTTQLPQCLANVVWQSASPNLDDSLQELARSVRGRLPRGSSITPWSSEPDAELETTGDRLAVAQLATLELSSRDVNRARRQQRRLDREIEELVSAHPFDRRISMLWAYNAKNGVLIDHDEEIRSGIRVTDPRIDEAQWRFLRTLWLDPFEPSALNGLGTVAWFAHDLEMAEFFVRAALRRAPWYGEAQHDLQLIHDLKRRVRPSRSSP